MTRIYGFVVASMSELRSELDTLNSHSMYFVTIKSLRCLPTTTTTRTLKIDRRAHATSKLRNIFGWLDLVATKPLPFYICQDRTVRCYAILELLCMNTFKKYMTLLTEQVAKKISACLGTGFPLIIDRRSSGSTNYIGLFASQMKNGVAINYMLALSPLLDESALTSEYQYEFISFILDVYNMKCNEILCVIAKNGAVSKAFSNRA